MELHMTDERAQLVKFVLTIARDWAQFNTAEREDLNEVIEAIGEKA